ncbi:MAG: cupin domain-containing protein [Clostridiales bacterium]|nr:cupin domain-containing protein [Clostridiales bacterium]
MDELLHGRAEDAPARRGGGHGNYEYTKRTIVSRDQARQCAVSVYELAPGKSAYPYHYHTQNEEVFYILSGRGVVRTPEGERTVSAGDFLFFPANEKGAHKITNADSGAPLVYIDFDTRGHIDAAFYPDSGKIGIWGMNINQLFKTGDAAGYYDGE